VIERVRADDARLAHYKDVRDADLIQRAGLFIAEGRFVVERLIGKQRFRLRSILVSDAAARQLSATLALVDTHVPIFVCDAADFGPIAGYDVHRGCLALVERPAPLDMAAIVSRAITLVVLEAVANPDNIGGVFRNASAFGVDAVVLSPACSDPLYRKAIRTSMAATLALPFARAPVWPQALAGIRAAGFAVVALTPTEPAQTLAEFAGQAGEERVALLIGNEGAGLSDPALAAADARVRIPTRADVDSLNLATAAGIALYALAASRDNARSRRSV
jgi:tRNA G18 (ribose-2'-O)-methylase SpoU